MPEQNEHIPRVNSMKKLIVTILSVWLSFGVFAELWAQGVEYQMEEDYIGCFIPPKKPRVYGGIITSVTVGSTRNYQPNNMAGKALTEVSNEIKFGYSTGLRLEYLLGDVKVFKALISADLMYGWMSFLHTSEDTVLSTTSEKMLGKYRLATTASAFTLNALYNLKIPGSHLFLDAGITTSYIFNVEHSYSVTASKAILPSSSTIATSDSGRTAQYLDAATNEVNSLQLGLIVGLRYDILIRKSILTPFVQFEYGINGMLSGGQARPMMVRAGCAWIFGM